MYVQIALPISKCAQQEQLLREGCHSVVDAYEQRSQGTCHLLYWQWWTDHIWWQQILLVHWLYLLYCHKENLRIWIFLWRSQKNSRPVKLCFTLFNKCWHCITTCEFMKEWQLFFYLGPNDLTISWIGIHRKSLLFPNVVHNSTTFKSSKTTTSIRTTSASEPIILIDLIPPETTCFSLHVGTYKGHLF